MSDWLGLFFFIFLIVGIYIGLKALSKPIKRTEDEFERNAAESASMLGASLNALQGILDPAEGKAKEVRIQMKEGHFNRKKREGKGNGTDLSEDKND